MTAAVFVDAKLLVYTRDRRFADKKAEAEKWLGKLWQEQRGRTSFQVLNEFYTTVTRKLKPGLSADLAWEDIQLLLAWNPQPIDARLLSRAFDIEKRYRLNWWDSLVVAAAQLQGCVLLLSEDMQDGAEYGGVIVRNPFILRVSEEHTAYTPVPALPSRHRGRGRPRRNPALPAAIAK
jgi:predicted nucleic acid-binding protein